MSNVTDDAYSPEGASWGGRFDPVRAAAELAAEAKAKREPLDWEKRHEKGGRFYDLFDTPAKIAESAEAWAARFNRGLRDGNPARPAHPYALAALKDEAAIVSAAKVGTRNDRL